MDPKNKKILTYAILIVAVGFLVCYGQEMAVYLQKDVYGGSVNASVNENITIEYNLTAGAGGGYKAGTIFDYKIGICTNGDPYNESNIKWKSTHRAVLGSKMTGSFDPIKYSSSGRYQIVVVENFTEVGKNNFGEGYHFINVTIGGTGGDGSGNVNFVPSDDNNSINNPDGNGSGQNGGGKVVLVDGGSGGNGNSGGGNGSDKNVGPGLDGKNSDGDPGSILKDKNGNQLKLEIPKSLKEFFENIFNLLGAVLRGNVSLWDLVKAVIEGIPDLINDILNGDFDWKSLLMTLIYAIVAGLVLTVLVIIAYYALKLFVFRGGSSGGSSKAYMYGDNIFKK
jgi:hypothetical protein